MRSGEQRDVACRGERNGECIVRIVESEMENVQEYGSANGQRAREKEREKDVRRDSGIDAKSGSSRRKERISSCERDFSPRAGLKRERRKRGTEMRGKKSASDIACLSFGSLQHP